MTEYAAIIPILIVALSAIAAMLAEAIRQPGERMPIAGFGLIGCVGAALASVFLWNSDARGFGVIRSDNFALFVNIILCMVGVLTMLFSDDVVERERIPPGEYYALTLFALCGMMMMAAATDLLVIFVALEILSLVGVRADRHPPQQRGGRRGGVQVLPARRLLERVLPLRHRVHLRAVVRLAPASRTSSNALSAQATGAPPTLALLAVGLLAVGFAFKVSAVPFHMWTPDAYEGAPTIVTAFMSTGVKAAAFAAFVRVFLSPLEPLAGALGPDALGHRGRDDDPRHRGRRRADQRQAHARVFEHRARRLPAARPDLELAVEPERQGGGPLLPARVRGDQPRRARHRRAARHRRSTSTTTCATSPASPRRGLGSPG